MVTPPVKLIGLDFGTTTSKALIVEARYRSDPLSGRPEIQELGAPYRSDIVFTPFIGDRIDDARIRTLLDGWLAAASARPEDIAGGGAIITGLCARRSNAADLAALIRARIGGAVIATADDPGLEAFLAFMGSAAALSRARPGVPLLNLDIGGGTSNLALGVDGEVLQVGCLFVGARHIEVEPGSYRITALSGHALRLLAGLGISARPGDRLAPEQVAAVLAFYIELLEAAVTGREAPFQSELGRSHVDIPFHLAPDPAPDLAPPWLSLSGGVGELVYQRLQGHASPATTTFGDLGIDLAARILASPVLSARLLVPEGGGRATSYGLLRSLTRLSGSTLYLPQPELLPLSDLAIFGRISATSTDEQIHAALALVRRSARGGCLTVSLAGRAPGAVKALGGRIGQALQDLDFPASLPLVLLVPDNVGKALGAYITGWGRLPVTLIVLDELAPKTARFVQIGRMVEQVVPVSFHGMGQAEEAS
ncbi:ethanolamine ammonia-lyase reactivating factor EutA [Nannocystis sp. ILAH1]|uniref:ethanolamine ammonia-lyase reactivating factor EutA n=1 Tax=Nannocystis sp. ILAH1 TaxID=2996789 RepID=UPI002271A724|nr:ethanolamine ammonia-lyase reactivating factor EutA [Nannocystis sp. ILAH1]MCY0989544.1 ethanolamine ammonia-lyase reactivating factor EutA [Nannocystis sp. ILAH1]